MLNRDGTFNFTEELMALVDAFLAEYEGTEGALHDDLERGLVMTYVLGAMVCDLELIWEALGGSPVFGRLDPLALYDECVQRNAGRTEARREVQKELVRRGWIPTGTHMDQTGMSGESGASEV